MGENTREQLLLSDWMGFQIFFLLVGFSVLQFGRQFPGVSARIKMIGVFASFFLAPVFA